MTRSRQTHAFPGYDPRHVPAPVERRALDDEPAAGAALQMRTVQMHAAHAQSRHLIQHLRGPVQRAGGGGGGDTAAVHAAAARGISGGGGALPHLEAIQRSFGRHDVSAVQAHVGGRAAEASAAMGADAYATGDAVAFARSPDLHTAAHEAAHVVQQRGGVSLKGGVGQVGDPYERHADAVADRVVQGESAEDLLDGFAGRGRSGAVQRQAASPAGERPAAQGAPPADGYDLDALLDLIWANYRHEISTRQKAIEDVEKDAAEKPAEKLDAALLKALAEVALSAAAAGVGSLIKNAIKTAVTAAPLQDAINSAIQNSIKATVHGAVDAASAGGGAHGALKGFFRGQWNTVSENLHAVETAFLGDVKPALKTAADGREQAQALYAAQEAAQGSVWQIQRQSTLEQWLLYIARTALGQREDGSTDLGDAVGDTSAKGVLGLRFESTRSARFTLVDAEMDGIGDGLAAEIGVSPIGALRIPVTVHGAVAYPAGVAEVRFGRNEADTVWEKSNALGRQWLHGWAHGPELWQSGPDRAHVDAARFEGARKLLREEIDSRTLSELGVRVQTEGGVFD